MFGLGKKSKNSHQKHELVKNLYDEKTKSDIILNSIDDGVILIDSEGKILLFNPAASRITGWQQGDATGIIYKSVLNIVNSKNEPYSDEQDPFSRSCKEVTTIRDNQANLLTESNKLIAINISVTPLLDQNKNITGAVGIFRDVTAERNAETQRAEFISTASHEMRTPVAAIEGYLALALNDKVAKIDTKARDYLMKAHTSAQHLGKLFQDLLTSAKAEDGRLQNHPQVIDIGLQLEQLTEDMRFSAEKKGLGMEFVIGTDDNSYYMQNRHEDNKVIRPIYYTYVDPERMREVIVNIFDNAVKYTDTGKISIGLTGNKDIVQIRVQDTGQGIPKEDVGHLFEKFYRVDNSSTRTIGGTGLGLFICRKIVELYNGRIWVESQVGKGSTFYINLPRLSREKAEYLKNQEDSRAGAAKNPGKITQPI